MFSFHIGGGTSGLLTTLWPCSACLGYAYFYTLSFSFGWLCHQNLRIMRVALLIVEARQVAMALTIGHVHSTGSGTIFPNGFGGYSCPFVGIRIVFLVWN